MKVDAHGGDLLDMAAVSGRDPASLLDFSVNIRPEGAPEFLRAALVRATSALSAYPSPHAEEALAAASRRYGISASRFAFGNGSNELIHALARALKKRGAPAVHVVEPAFSEYATASRLAGLPVNPIWGGIAEEGSVCRKNGTGPSRLLQPLAGGTPPAIRLRKTAVSDLLRALSAAPAGAAVFLANPGNPSGVFRAPDEVLSFMTARPDLLWIVDEAFIEYAGPEAAVSLVCRMPANSVILRSLTKFYGVPGVRLGWLAAPEDVAEAVRAELPAWNVNAFALAAAVAALNDASDFADRTRAQNAERRADLIAVLSEVPGVEVFPSFSNYVLFRLAGAPSDLCRLLLQRFGIAVRDCSNYHGLRDGTWFRAAVRLPEDHRRLGAALEAVVRANAADTTASPRLPGRSSRATPALMVQGTSSNAGKSILAAAYCRIFHQDGYSVAPFKAQNMSLNSGVTATGEEMSRAQIVQAQAARADPDVRMNPILLKPHSDTGSQVVVLGRPLGHKSVLEYYAEKKQLWDTVTRSYDALAAEHDIMVLEGAGSPGEVNLKAHDLVNMRMAGHARASVLLVGDIDRGGVYASFLGTWMTFTVAERRLLAGYIVNRFRGDPSLLEAAHVYLSAHTGVPVLGVIPFIRDLHIPEEDTAGFFWIRNAGPKQPGTLDIAVVMPDHVSNYTDFAPLAAEPDVRLRPVRRPEEWGEPDVVMLPGSKSVAADLEALRRSGLADAIIAHARRGRWLFGICGGLQMLGRVILDPEGVESSSAEVAGLGIMDLRSTFAVAKTLVRVDRAETPLGLPSSGYEIHHALTEHGPAAVPSFLRTGPAWTTEAERVCGYVTGRCWATYLHGVFDDDAFRRAWLDHVRADLGLSPQGRQLVSHDLEKTLDRLADVVREHSDMQTIYRSLGLQ